MYAWADRTTTYRHKANKLEPAGQYLFQECLTTYELITNAVVIVTMVVAGDPPRRKVCGYNNIGAATGMSFSIAKGSFLA